MKKPSYVSHYLVLKDLINNIDVRQSNDVVVYLTSRIENIKVDLVKNGILFIEDVIKQSKYSSYKPYILKPTLENINNAKKLLKRYATKDILEFLNEPYNIEDS